VHTFAALWQVGFVATPFGQSNISRMRGFEFFLSQAESMPAPPPVTHTVSQTCAVITRVVGKSTVPEKKYDKFCAEQSECYM
jgi:hypothetical protein